jgi:hypothetical protein
MLSRLLTSARSLFIVGVAIVGVVPGFAQGTLELANGTKTKVTLKLDRALGHGPKLKPRSSSPLPSAGLPFFTANFLSLGSKELPFNIVGTDPSLGAGTTIVPSVLVPLKFVFPNPGNPVLDGTNVIAATQNSPIFLTADYTTGGVDLGFTQFGDAIQRGQFWNLPGFSQAGYHVLLGTPSVAATVTVTVPAGAGNAFQLLHGGFLGVVDPGFFDQVLGALLPSYTANQLPIFMTDNVVLGSQGQLQFCCALGFHTSAFAPNATAQTWVFATFLEPGTFVGDPILDVQGLSHEVSEWLNDPFAGGPLFGGVNLVAPYVLPGSGGACQLNFETGDVLESPPAAFVQITNGTKYHLQDEAFLPYFLHTAPSFSVGGFYSFLGTFQTFSTLCGPG